MLVRIFVIIVFCSSLIMSVHFPKYSSYFSHFDFVMSDYSIVNKELTDNSFSFIIRNFQKKFKQENSDPEFLKLDVFLVSKNVIQFILKDANRTAFELPKEEPFPYHNYDKKVFKEFISLNSQFDYEFDVKEFPFSLTIMRRSTKEIIFSTVNQKFKILSNYLEISSEIPSNNIYGLGERTTSFRLKSGIYTLYNKDLYGEIEDGLGNGKNRYGSHPMYLMREQSGYYHISYLRNSFPMDVIVNNEKRLITYKIIGGVLDFSFFLGDKKPETSIKMYHKYLGGFSLPPFWSMGFHQCRWGYKNLDMVKEVLKNYESNDLPLDTIWLDIDYMNDFMPWTVDTDRFNLKDFDEMLKKYKKKFVMIAEPSVGTKWGNSYEYLALGKELDIFIKNKEKNYLLNKVWPGKSHFVDYFNPKTKDYWHGALSNFHEKINFSGVWLDMNEIAAFNLGQMDMYDNTLSCKDDNNYPYLPGSKPLETATICPNAFHYNDMKHVEVHNYYPNQQAKLTFEWLETKFPDQYPFILSRANAPGLGKYSAHWSGDNYGNYDFYKFSISEVLNSNLFGIPLTGADICGFGYNTPELLCSKFYQTGSLFPFSRSHSHIDYYRKEPYAMGPLLLETTRKSLQFRYSILKYYYSLFMLSNKTGTIMRPLFFEFYDDENTLSDKVIDSYFMIGDSLLVVPNLNDDWSEESEAYFPKGMWYDLRNNEKVQNEEKAGFIKVRTNLKEMPAVFLRSGKTIFTNDIENVKNSFELNNKYNFIISLQKDDIGLTNYYSNGIIPALNDFNSKKQIENCTVNNCYIKVQTSMDLKVNELNIVFQRASYYDDSFVGFVLKKIIVFGIDSKRSFDDVIINSNKKDSTKIKILKVNDNSIIIELIEEITIHKEEFKILIKFN